jgi:pyruvate dehydrogenase E2 component (dihydrolipoamide acetyltransferase)
MAEIVVLTKMNLTMESGLLALWYKNEGETVASGEALCLIENEKETEDLLSPADGRIVRIWAAAGEQYDVGTPLCLIALPGEDDSSALEQAELAVTKLSASHSPSSSANQPSSIADAAISSFRILPKMRNLAKQSGITVEELQAYFGGVSITENHIRQYAAHREASHEPARDLGSGRRVKMSPMRQAIADKMAASCTKTARLTNFMEVDMTAALDKMAALKQSGVQVSLTALVIKVCAEAMREHEMINTVLDDEANEIIYRDACNIGFAVDLTGGLIVPVIQNADQKTVFEISTELAVLAQAAQAGKLDGHATRGGTFTVSNVGMLGIDSFTPIIRYPETAILGVGEIKTLPRYLGDDYSQVYPRRIMKISLTYDHRVIDGAPASRFMLAVRTRLEDGRDLA